MSVGLENFTSAQLIELCAILEFNPNTELSSVRLLNSLAVLDRQAWVSKNVQRIESEICRLGSHSFGKDRRYIEVLLGLGEKLEISKPRPSATIEEIEQALLKKVWNDQLAKLTPEQIQELRAKTLK